MKFPLLIPCLTLTVTAAIITTSSAQDLLEPLYVTASRSSQIIGDVPYSATYLDADDLAEDNRRTLPKALLYTPGVLVQQTTFGHGSPFIRGFTGRRNLLLVDGVRINNSTYRGGPIQYWNTIDSESIDHLELIKSQGSVLYGSDAIGGTLNAFTKSSNFRDHTEGEFFNTGRMAYEHRMNGEGSHVGRIESQTGVGGEYGLHLGLSLKDFGDISSDDLGRMRGTGYPEQDFDLRFDMALDGHSTLTFVSQYVNQDKVNRWHSTANNPGWVSGNHVVSPGNFVSRIYDQERMLTYLRYTGENPEAGAFINRWSATLSHQATTDSEFQERNNPLNDRNIRQRDIELDTFGFDLSLETDVEHGTWVYGLDYYRDEVNSSGFDNNNAGSAFAVSLPLADDSSYDLLGAFGQCIWRPNKDWEVTLGSRYTYARASLGSGINESPSWDALVGSLRVLHRLDEEWSLYAGISQAFRAPNLDDLTGQQTSKAGVTSLGSLNVEPENYLTYELGARRVDEDFSFSAAVFYTDITDQIIAIPDAPLSTTERLVNASEGFLYGVEVEGIWQFSPRWSLRAFAAWQDGETEQPQYLGGPIIDASPTRLLPLTGSVALRWTSEDERFWIQGRLFGAMTEDRLSAAQQNADRQRIPTNGTPGYVVASINGGWQVNENLSLTAGVENLLDKDYRIHGSGQNEPGITGIFGAEWVW